MAGLNEEIKVLRERLSTANADIEQLRATRDELLAAQPDAQESPAIEVDDAAAYRSRIADLQVTNYIIFHLHIHLYSAINICFYVQIHRKLNY